MTTPRPILRKKKSVTFHPSTKPSSSATNSPAIDIGAWSTTSTSSSPPSAGSPSPSTRSRKSRGRGGGSQSPSPSRTAAAATTTTPANKTALQQQQSRPQRKRPKLLDYAHLPPWLKDNVHILSSYRAPSHSHAASLPSLWYVHNETCNVWSHLLGLLLFGGYGVFFLATMDVRRDGAGGGAGLAGGGGAAQATPADWVAFAAFFAGVCACLAASAAYHLFSNVGPVEARVWNGVDYAGIVACIWGSFFAALHFGLPDDADLKGAGGGAKGGGGGGEGKGGAEGFVRFGADGRVVDEGRARRRGYEAMISTLALVCTAVSVLPRFRTPAWRPFRAAMFVAMGLSAVAPVLHGLQLYGWKQLDRQMGLSWVVLQGVLYIVGAALYAARIPERLAPGKFDVFGASHQIFHVLVVLAAASHLKGLTVAFNHACSVR